MGSIETPGQFKTVDTTLNYYVSPEDGGTSSYIPGSFGSHRRKLDPLPAQIHDIRGRESEFSLDKQGFELLQHHGSPAISMDDEKIRLEIYPEAEELLKKATGATRVKVFSHLKRASSPEEIAALARQSTRPDSDMIDKVIPAQFVHIDQSEQAAITILKDEIPGEEASKLLKTRWAIINVWRPLRPIMKDPLGVCDARSVRDEDLYPVTVILPRKGTTKTRYDVATKTPEFDILQLKQHPMQRWYFASGMTPEEALLIKIYDSKKDCSVARRTPHTAFTDPNLPNNVTRESLEIRCFVFWEDQSS